MGELVPTPAGVVPLSPSLSLCVFSGIEPRGVGGNLKLAFKTYNPGGSFYNIALLSMKTPSLLFQSDDSLWDVGSESLQRHTTALCPAASLIGRFTAAQKPKGKSPEGLLPACDSGENCSPREQNRQNFAASSTKSSPGL